MKNNLQLIATFFCCLLIQISKAQTSAIDNKLSKTITFRAIPNGPTVFGIFQGRPSCAGYARQLKTPIPADCTKLKSELILYRDPANLQATTYTLSVIGVGDTIKQDGGSYQRLVLEGKWTIIKGIKSNPDAEVVALKLNKTQTYIYLMKGDENVLFVLDENKEFLVGDEDFSYTLNRVELVAGKK